MCDALLLNTPNIKALSSSTHIICNYEPLKSHLIVNKQVVLVSSQLSVNLSIYSHHGYLATSKPQHSVLTQHHNPLQQYIRIQHSLSYLNLWFFRYQITYSKSNI